jgi:soluble lytic murein transglycosylase-like protein
MSIAPVRFIVPNQAARLQMHPKKIIWGISLTLLLSLTFYSPLPANAQPPQDPPITGSGKSRSNTANSKPYLLSDVWALTLKHQRAYKSHFTPELITCLMWEESGFRLIQNPTSPAVGFGQIMPATLREVNKHFGTKLTPQDLLNSPDSSVKATVLTLELMWNWKKNKEAALLAYAGGIRNHRYVRKWLNAEPRMIQARYQSLSSGIGSAHLSDEFLDAFHLCSQPGFHPTDIAD